MEVTVTAYTFILLCSCSARTRISTLSASSRLKRPRRGEIHLFGILDFHHQSRPRAGQTQGLFQHFYLFDFHLWIICNVLFDTRGKEVQLQSQIL